MAKTLKHKTHLFRMDTKGELLNAYSPLLNLSDKFSNLGDFTTSELNFDKYTPVDMLITDEYDGSTQIIINDDKNSPKLINSRFSVLENNTFNIPIHNGNAVTNIYEENTFSKDSQLLKLYDSIPNLLFLGLKEGGEFKCGSYVFYFKLSDADGNTTNIVQESSIVQVHIGAPNSKKVRMGMLDENAEKCISFKLTGIDPGFDYVKVFYERKSTNDSLALVDSYFMINQNFPIRNGICEILLTGTEDTLLIVKSDMCNEFADIQTVKTQAIVDNVLFLGNVSAYELNYSELQLFAWRIVPRISVKTGTGMGQINSSDYSFTRGCGYYDIKNVYDNTGYWGEEFYRFGIVFIYTNNILSPVFNIQGLDMGEYFDSSLAFKDGINEDDYYKSFFDNDGVYRIQEPDDFFFNKIGKHNSKGVIKLPKVKTFRPSNNTSIELDAIRILFDMSVSNNYNYLIGGQQSRTIYKSVEDFLIQNNIKGFFFVRQKRIPTIIALGMVVGLTGRHNGCIPVLLNSKKLYITKSFLNSGRMLLKSGSTVVILRDEEEDKDNLILNKALLVPDYDINEATLNLIFTGQEFLLQKVFNTSYKIIGDHHCVKNITYDSKEKVINDVKLTAVPKETTLVTDGENYFSTVAGNPNEPYKTADVNHIWNRTVPQELTASTSLIRGNWGSFVGMSTDKFDYGDIVNIRLNTFSDKNQVDIEFLKRFSDFSLYSAISPRYNVSDVKKLGYMISCARGDCFSNIFTHRMMSNFIDPELPTNHLIIDPGCWAKNYAVRCTAEILKTTHSNLTSDSGGWYIPSPVSKKSAIVSLIFGILTCNIGIAVNAVSDLKSASKGQSSLDKYANEIVQAFEIYVGDISKLGKRDLSELGDSDQVSSETKIKELVEDGHIKKVEPKELELNATGFNLKALFKSDDKWELHGLASINRADINAVSFGSWITFPVCSNYNLAFRDIDFSNAIEETSLLKKRSFYPLEDMDPTNHVLESNKINGAAKVSLASNNYPAFLTVPYIKLEYFNRIYWSKPNVTDNFINSYRIIFKDLYKEYNKEFGSITKILPLGNSLLVVLQHGIGMLPVNKAIENANEASPYLSSRNVLPSLLATLSKDYGSMWKDSIILTPKGLTYGVDTVAKKIWRIYPDGSKFEFLSDFKVQKFLNDWIDLSEYNYNEYQGHINVKTHYNEFKHDVIFTYYKDIPYTKHEYLYNEETEQYDIVLIGTEGNWNSSHTHWIWQLPNEEDVDYIKADLSGNLILQDTLDPKPLIDKWEPGKTWSLCYNEINSNFITFYDWYPVESCNIDNIFFSFDKEAIDSVLSGENKNTDVLAGRGLPCFTMNRVFMDKMFTDLTKVYMLEPSTPVPSVSFNNYVPITYNTIPTYLCLYYKSEHDLNPLKGRQINTVSLGHDSEWKFTYTRITNPMQATISGDFLERIYVAECTIVLAEKLTIKDPVLMYLELRDSTLNRMYLWKHGLAGLYDNQGKIKPTHWYGKQHEFNFEFIVNEAPQILKVFNNLKIISNKTAPNKFEYEIVGEGYDWFDLKPVIQWINTKYKEDLDSSHGTTEEDKFKYWYTLVLSNPYWYLRTEYEDFPELYKFEGTSNSIRKLPFLHLETTDKKGTSDKNKTYSTTDYWTPLTPSATKDYKYSFNTSETIIVEDEQLNELRIHTESLGNDMKRYGRIRGNMQYLEDLWDIEIRPINFLYAYYDEDTEELKFIKSKESRHRDKYIKIKVRYTGQDLAVILGILTSFDISYA